MVQGDSLGCFVTKKLMEPYTNKGYCVTTDNFFSSLKLEHDFINRKTTFTGTMR